MTTAPASPDLPAAVLPGTARRLTALLASAQAEHRLPSVAVGLVRDGELVWWASRGLVAGARPTPATQYRIGSITKTFVAAAVLRAVQDGLAGLDDPVGAHLPELTGTGALTVGQLLAQSSGVRAETEGPWWERTPGGDWSTLLPQLGEEAVRLRPGTRFHYSNVGYAILGELVARLRGRGWAEVVAEQFLRPLGMRRTTLRPSGEHAPGLAVHPWADVVLPEPEHDAGAMAPAGQLWSTVGDLARWAGALAGREPGALDPAVAASMRELQAADDQPGGGWSSGYGLGLQLWNEGGRLHAGHSGSMPGFVAMLRADVSSGDAVLALTNSTTGFGDLPARLLAAYAEAEPPLAAEWQPQRVDADVLELVGPWYWGPAPLVLSATADGGLRLAGMQQRARASRLRRARAGEQGDWVGLDGYYAGEPLRVLRGPDGAVRALDLASFRITRSPYPLEEADLVPGGVDPAGWRPGTPGGRRSGDVL
ncbi:CubicO group peptidase (beta-lactamase class C family) [Kineococcus xinjiangensis]|uniref:CubicO group peptidase (Beta-lactamase class C family) n=1 Tax=Kineococcus xinjiangensis TaxID=512762 RepID=A0A2S6IMF0_9ACTN|nr:serine hydrolase domain-containing protein [Kineococcus xinjiangensis]PPK95335.1 CubicO group peptidase (beta-lactamase class C family) [Kineococcus xinjiangensis]